MTTPIYCHFFKGNIMTVYFHHDFYEEYTLDPAAESGRMEAIVEELSTVVELV